jgi:hypothetical protein
MQLDELQQQWQQLDQKLDQALALQKELLRQVGVRPVQRRISRFAFWPAIDLIFAAGVVLFAGSCLGDHWSDWKVAMPAIVVMAGGIALAASNILQLDRVSKLDWSGPIAEIQSGLEKLRAMKIRQFKWVILCSPLVGFCAFVICTNWGFQTLVDNRIHILDRFDPWWIGGNYAFGVLFIPVGYFVARFLAERYQGRPWFRAVLDDISGRSLKIAVRDIEHWVSLQGSTTTGAARV